MQDLDRITQSHEVMGGRACIRGMRVTVGMVVGQIGAGCSIDEVLATPIWNEKTFCRRCAMPPGAPRRGNFR